MLVVDEIIGPYFRLRFLDCFGCGERFGVFKTPEL
jgi:hypothetical protein